MPPCCRCHSDPDWGAPNWVEVAKISCVLVFNSPVLLNACPRVVVRSRQESTESLKTLLVLHIKTFEMTKPSIMQVIILM